MRFPSKSTLLKAATAITLLAGVVLRILGAWWYRNDPNPDYAIVVEMVRNMVRGNGWPVFFYGQAYMGSLEPTAGAVFAWLLGPSAFAVCLGTAFFGALLLFAVRRWAADAAGPWAGVLAMAAAAIGPPAYFQYMGSPRGGYALGLLLIVVVLREGCRIASLESSVTSLERPCVRRRRYARLGLLAGIAFWNFWLVLPAVATAGMMLVASLRGRLLRRRVLLPGIGGFLVGSIPFWVYNVGHGWASFTAPNGGAPGLGEIPATLRLLFTTRFPKLFNLALPAPWQLVLTGCFVVLVLLGVVLLLPRRIRSSEPRFWMLPTVVVFCALFGAAYVLSSFGRIDTPRYLLPAVPLLAVLSGVVPVLLWRAARSIGAMAVRRVATIGATLLGALLVAGPLAGEVLSLRLHHARAIANDAWKQRAEVTADELLSRGIRTAIVDYMHWGFNWAGDERVVFSSPHLERYRPYALALESDENPAVIENFRGFSHFLAATGGRAESLPVSGLRVMANVTAPEQAVTVLSDEVIADLLDDVGRSVRRAATDQFCSTMAGIAAYPRHDRHLDIRLASRTKVCGVRFWSFNQRSRAWFSIEAMQPDGTYAPLTPLCVDSGFHWSGPCFFWEGMEHHFDLRFAPVETDSLRLRVSAPRGATTVMVNDVDILAPSAPRPVADPAAIAKELVTRNARRVHAGRWLAARLRPLLPGDIWVSPLPDREVSDDALTAATIVPDEGTVLLSDPGDEEPVRRGLAMMGAPTDEVPLAGVMAFFLRRPPSEQLAFYRGAKFLGASVQHGHPSELAAIRGEPPAPPPPLLAQYEGGAFGITAIRPSVAETHPGDTIDVVVEWFFAAGTSPSANLFQGLHFLVDGKRVFQCDVPFQVELDDVDEAGRQRYVSRFSIAVPKGVSGDIVPAFCLYRPGLRSQRLAPDTDLPTSRKRILLPPIPCRSAP